jgi:membrane protease YdiL (CAAX protease family)
VILIFAANRFTDESFRSLGWTDDNMVRNSLIGLVVGAGFFFVLSLSKKFEFHKLGPAIFFGFLIAAWQEENIFRGYLIKYLDERFDVEVTIIYQALIYSLCHIGFYLISPVINLIVSLVFAFIAGLVFGFLRLKTKSQIPGFLAHGIIDLAFLIT